MSKYQYCYTVSELNTKIRKTLNQDFSKVWVTGEVSNFHHHPNSGHMYFTVKDNSCEISCTMFRMQNRHLNFNISSGMEVRLEGTVTLYERRGQLQLNITNIEPAGVGELYKAFEELKKLLSEEQLFDQKYKKTIPKFPSTIGIITSESSAAYQDILNVLNRRAPYVKIILYDVKVQGDGASEEIVKGIKSFNDKTDIDTIIIARGGGSIEDLWPFNNENVGRTIFDSSIPIISAVGHETDFTIADFVADVRAPTPSAGAEISVPLVSDLMDRLSSYKNGMRLVMHNIIEQGYINIFQIEKRVNYLKPSRQIKIQNEKLKHLHSRFLHLFIAKQEKLYEKIDHYSKDLFILSPNHILDRGYSIPFDDSGKIIKFSRQINVGDSFKLKMAKGSLIAKKTSDILE